MEKLKIKHLVLVIVAALGLSVGTFGVTTQTANANTVYHRSSIKTTKSTPYYSYSNKGKTYIFKGSASHFTFKTNHNLKSYHNTTWNKTKQTTVKRGHSAGTYYYVKNAKTGATGWVNAVYMHAGKNYQMTHSTAIDGGTYIEKSNGKIYQLDENSDSNWFHLEKGQSLNNNATYTVASQRTLYTKGKSALYYYVDGTDGLSGWVWQGYLTKGTHRIPTDVDKQPTDRNGVTRYGDPNSQYYKDGYGFSTYTENANSSWTKEGNEWSDKVRALIKKGDVEHTTAKERAEADYSYNSRGQKIDYNGNVVK